MGAHILRPDAVALGWGVWKSLSINRRGENFPVASFPACHDGLRDVSMLMTTMTMRMIRLCKWFLQMQRHAGCLGRASSRPSCSWLHVPHVPGKSESELIWCLNVLCFFRRSLIQNYFPHKMYRKRIDLALRCNMLPQLMVYPKKISTQCTNNLYFHFQPSAFPLLSPPDPLSRIAKNH